MIIRILVWIYFVLLFSFLIVYFVIKKHLIIIIQELQQYLDNIFFEISKSLFNNKDKIVKFEEFAQIFQTNKKDFFSIKNKRFEDYINFRNKYKDDIKYFESMLEEQVMDIDLITQTQHIVEWLVVVSKYYNFVRKLLCIFTFGLFCFIK